ncbi:MAG: DUF2760 domain-containing protein [Desulfosarcina sp.]|nr:DUF2760 domain-containing protein [Desulfosarcina sp.]MBC2741928.1 DUF2760 domain-containing protein [Desulfosarcina sp.]MBC2764841.1 DUF2760 domain-containing protein [Desulfosarcina sp.]
MKLSLLLKSFSLRAFFQSLFFSTLLFAIIACFYWRSRDVGFPINVMDYASLFVFLTFFGTLHWMFVKNTLSKLAAGQPDLPQVKKVSPPQALETDADRAKRKNQEKRLFIHLFAVLQRQGRLMDFLQEDLSLYEDDQIGAAVRSIHENCRKTVDRYLSPKPVMKQAEGETVEIAAGFDQHAVKLVGNVVGQPPFTGILRHRGWQLRSISLPKLSDTENPNIIAPAEVEIQ